MLVELGKQLSIQISDNHDEIEFTEAVQTTVQIAVFVINAGIVWMGRVSCFIQCDIRNVYRFNLKAPTRKESTVPTGTTSYIQR